MMTFERLEAGQADRIREMSEMATEIVREHFDPIIGREQNDYMLERFQSVRAVTEQLKNGYRYYFVEEERRNIGFLAFYPKPDCLYLSKFYLYKEMRGRGRSRRMMEFVISQAKDRGLSAIELNVNRHNPAARAYDRLGFQIARTEKTPIGGGFVMDDYVYRLEIPGSMPRVG